MKNGTHLIVLLGVLILISSVMTACGTGAPASTSANPQTASTPLDGQALLQERCTRCHNLERVTSSHKSADQWQTTVTRMIGKGAQIDEQEQLILVNYLSLNYR